MAKSCPFCTSPEIKARTVAQNRLAFSFPTNIPVVQGHLLICPKRHVAKISHLSIAEWTALYQLGKRLQPALKAAFRARGFNFAWNEGAAAGQNVNHFHLHLLPRKAGDSGVDPRKAFYRPGPRLETPEDELLDVARRVKRRLKS